MNKTKKICFLTNFGLPFHKFYDSFNQSIDLKKKNQESFRIEKIP